MRCDGVSKVGFEKVGFENVGEEFEVQGPSSESSPTSTGAQYAPVDLDKPAVPRLVTYNV